jgi:hypothetical protein
MSGDEQEEDVAIPLFEGQPRGASGAGGAGIYLIWQLVCRS